MFKVETSQSIDRELMKKGNISFPDLIVKSLKLIGFIDIQKHGNKISFRHDFKDTTLESFQRRFGSGYLTYKIDQKNATINIVTENSIYLTLSIFGNAFVFFAANYQFIFNSNENLSFILIFNTILILLNVYGIWTTKRRYKTKHLGLLEWIDGKINEISKRKKMNSSIPDYIIISKSEDNSKTVITIKPRKINGYDYFFMFFFLFGLGFLIATITTNHIDFTSIMAGLIFLGLFGKLIIEMWISLKETQVISINKNHLEISRKIKTRKSQHIDKKAIKDIKFEGIGLFGDYSKIYLSFKNILTVVGYKIPVIKTNESNLMIAEHHDEYLRKWITNYLKKKI